MNHPCTCICISFEFSSIMWRMRILGISLNRLNAPNGKWLYFYQVERSTNLQHNSQNTVFIESGLTPFEWPFNDSSPSRWVGFLVRTRGFVTLISDACEHTSAYRVKFTRLNIIEDYICSFCLVWIMISSIFIVIFSIVRYTYTNSMVYQQV